MTACGMLFLLNSMTGDYARAAAREPGGGGTPMMPVSRRQAGWLPCLDPIVCLDKLRGVVSNRSAE